jgi:hypothetical protein
MPGRIDGRNEKRNAIHVPVELASLDEPGHVERAITENVSLLGTRVVTMRPWSTGQNVLIVTPSRDARVRAHIVYCQALGDQRFAIGLRFLEVPVGRTLVPTGRSG